MTPIPPGPVTVVVGNPRSNSRTRTAAVAIASELAGREPDAVIELSELGAELLDWSSPPVAAAVEQVSSSGLVVVASPTFKGAYTGLLKLFLDRFSAGSLSHVQGVALMLGGDVRHSLAPEAFLKPVLSEIGLSMPDPGLFVVDSTVDETFVSSEPVAQWLSAARARRAAVPG